MYAQASSAHRPEVNLLSFQILGASSEKEVMSAMIFEEIMHRLPKVKTLQVISHSTVACHISILMD